jgi:hypothetical protein
MSTVLGHMVQVGVLRGVNPSLAGGVGQGLRSGGLSGLAGRGEANQMRRLGLKYHLELPALRSGRDLCQRHPLPGHIDALDDRPVFAEDREARRTAQRQHHVALTAHPWSEMRGDLLFAGPRGKAIDQPLDRNSQGVVHDRGQY